MQPEAHIQALAALVRRAAHSACSVSALAYVSRTLHERRAPCLACVQTGPPRTSTSAMQEIQVVCSVHPQPGNLHVQLLTLGPYPLPWPACAGGARGQAPLLLRGRQGPAALGVLRAGAGRAGRRRARAPGGRRRRPRARRRRCARRAATPSACALALVGLCMPCIAELTAASAHPYITRAGPAKAYMRGWSEHNA